MPPRLRAAHLATSLLGASLKPHSPCIAALSLTSTRCASILSSLSDNAGAYNKKIRRGRGPASGKGKTSGRGQKGQHAHGKVPAGFEGGQTPLSITHPERGRSKYNPFKVEMSAVNLDRVQAWIDQGRLDPARPITMKELAKSRCLHGVKKHGVKLLARVCGPSLYTALPVLTVGFQNAEQLTSPVHIVVSRASAEAIDRVEALGGSVTTRFYSPTAVKRVLRGDSHPIVSLQAPSTLLALAASDPAIASSPILSSLQPATGDDNDAASSPLAAIMARVGQKYKYRLPDATARKDIEYYRDPAHRGYLAHLVKPGESPSLFFKPPVEIKDRRKQVAKRNKAKTFADNRLF